MKDQEQGWVRPTDILYMVSIRAEKPNANEAVCGVMNLYLLYRGLHVFLYEGLLNAEDQQS